MKMRVLGCFGVSLAWLLFAHPSQASSTACGMQMQPPDCREIPSGYAWAPSSQPTIGLGCIGYPSPGPMTDAGYVVAMPNYFLPTVSSAKFTIEVDGQMLTGGTFTDAGITCREDCNLDGGWANCPMQALVRYSGPLIPGREHKVIWTNQHNPYTDEPVTVLFMVSAASSVSTGSATDMGTATGSAPAGHESSTDTSVGTGLFPVDIAQSTDAGIVESEPSSASCSCAVGARTPASLSPLVLIALIGFRRRD